ncbi:MAG: hypothetical protein IJ325_01780 [Clostridia bacterium]|nr:hypothetical protein [Clostridia bacterium]
MNTRMDRNRFYFGFHGLNGAPLDEQRIREIAETGVDFLMHSACLPKLDLFEKYGLGVISTWFNPLPHWGGEGYGYVGRMEEKFPLERYTKPAETFKDHPAIWGLGMGDEPNAVDFPYIGTVVDAVNNAYPNQFPFLNLYPIHARVAENTEDQIKSDLGTMTYQEYIDKYCAYIPNHYISFDMYPYRGSPRKRLIRCRRMIPRYFENLRLVAEACRKTDRDLWVVVQGNHDEGDDYGPPSIFMTLNQLRFQVYAAMAFGVKTIMWWESWIFTDDGEKTEQYDRITQIHNEVHALAEEYMKYRNVSTHFVSFKYYLDYAKVNQETVDSLYTGVFLDVKTDVEAPLIIGQMASRVDNSQALMVFAADDPFDVAPLEYNVTFQARNKTITAYRGAEQVPVTRLEDGSYSVPISSNQGILIVAR